MPPNGNAAAAEPTTAGQGVEDDTTREGGLPRPVTQDDAVAGEEEVGIIEPELGDSGFAGLEAASLEEVNAGAD